MVRWSRHCADTGLVYLHGMYYQCGWNLLTHLESLQVVSSVIAAWSDVSHATSTGGLSSVTSAVATLNIGYIWMFGNCLTSAAYVSIFAWKKGRVTYIVIFGRFWLCARGSKRPAFLTGTRCSITIYCRFRSCSCSLSSSKIGGQIVLIEICACPPCGVAVDGGACSHDTRFRYSPPETRNLLLFAIAFSGAAAVGISYTTAWCIRVTSSTTYR